ncbi:MAG: molybdenum cofactor guanylyltransferase [Kofleriaceae bacterium]
MNVSALILAGGKATRLGGIDKRELRIDGVSIFERQVAVLAPLVAEIIVSSPREIAGFRCVTDAIEGAGPLAGIAAGLAAMRTEWLVVVAGDMPYITAALVELVISRIADDHDAVGIRIGDLPEPLFCALRSTVAPAIERRLGSGQRKASRLLTDGDLRVCWLTETALRAIDPELRALFNVNTPADLDRGVLGSTDPV